MCKVLSENPAKLYGMFGRKGIIAPGADADIVVIDPAAEGVITAGDQIANVDYTPYEGVKTQGKITQVYLRGALAVDAGRVVSETTGVYIPRGVRQM